MKNLICFLIFVIFCGVVFFTGWTQIKVKPDTIGIVQSKTGGINQKPVIPGQFSWHKEFLIPTNAEINKFKNQPFNTTKTISGKRTAFSSENYSNIKDILDYQFTFQISLSYTPDVLVNLINENIISNQEDLEKYLDGVSAYLAQRTANYFLQELNKNPDFRPEEIRLIDLLGYIGFYKEYPDFDVTVLALNNYKLPYYSIYDSIGEEL